MPSFICKQVNENVKQTFSVGLKCRILLKFTIYLLFKVCSVKSQSIPNNQDALKFNDLLDSMNLVQHVKGSTHRHGHTLDLIITRREEKYNS